MTAQALEEEIIAGLVRRYAPSGGVIVHRSGCGTGKTTAALKGLVGTLQRETTAALEQGEGPLWSITYHAPTHAVRDEQARLVEGPTVPVYGIGEHGPHLGEHGCAFPAALAKARAALPTGARDHCAACQLRPDGLGLGRDCGLLRLRRAAHGAPHTTVRVSTTAAFLERGEGADLPFDLQDKPRGRGLTILDETFLPHVFPIHGLTLEDLEALEEDGVGVGEALRAALVASKERTASGRPDKGRALQDLAARVGLPVEGLLQVKPSATFEAGKRALQQGDEAPHWRALEALRAAARVGVLGVLEVAHGALQVREIRPVPQPQRGEAVLLLDATCSLQVVRALFPECAIVEVSGPSKERFEAFEVGGSVRQGLFSNAEERAASKGGRLARMWARIVERGALGFAPRRYLQDEAHPLQSVPVGKGVKVYHGDPRSRGSNEWAGCDEVALLPFHVPHFALAALASSLVVKRREPKEVHRRRVGRGGDGDWVDTFERFTLPPLTFEDALEEAHEALEGSQQYQQVHRIRPTRHKGRRVFLFGQRATARLREEADVVGVPEWAAWVVEGGDERFWDGLRPALVEVALARGGGAWSPSPSAGALASGLTVRQAREALLERLPEPLRLPLQPSPGDDKPLESLFGDHWAAVDLPAGARVVAVQGPRGVRVMVAVHADTAYTAASLKARLWPDLADAVGAAQRVLDAMKEAGEAATWGGFLARAGLTRQAWEKRLRAAGTSLKEMGEGAPNTYIPPHIPQNPKNLTDSLDKRADATGLLKAPREGSKAGLEARLHLDKRADVASEQATFALPDLRALLRYLQEQERSKLKALASLLSHAHATGSLPSIPDVVAAVGHPTLQRAGLVR